ncbi:helix-turn-helix domain-containing protein [Pseudodonghicola flavimaris]|uniref:Helix-turn-helix transcriptional regulator n=1 Tax=Pseudodonghicola flavimaris TaxID=3050036 RepID=A0ABT7F073_9RHOB|nr:helix-turn-helix transcriptional regulator [Pseudodonghicola flavimaris]MDK3018007.1 helix-turn-helix transcriptional regulator [Pseudodonghicola flavimaris]
MTETETDWFGPDAATFGDRVAGAREAAGMTQSQLARRLGVKRTTVRAWEEDLSEPRANKLSMMAGLLNVSIMWLLTGEGDGMTAPVDEDDEDGRDLRQLLGELRSLQSDMRALAERAARTEKKLRALVERKQE